MRIVLEPVEKNRIVVIPAGRYDGSPLMARSTPGGREMRVRNEGSSPVRAYEVIRVLVAVEVQERGRKHGRPQSQ